MKERLQEARRWPGSERSNAELEDALIPKSVTGDAYARLPPKMPSILTTATERTSCESVILVLNAIDSARECLSPLACPIPDHAVMLVEPSRELHQWLF